MGNFHSFFLSSSSLKSKLFRSNLSRLWELTRWVCRERNGIPGTPHWSLRWRVIFVVLELTWHCSAGPLCCRQYLLLLEAGLHLLCQPLPGASPGQTHLRISELFRSELTRSDQDKDRKSLLFLSDQSRWLPAYHTTTTHLPTYSKGN